VEMGPMMLAAGLDEHANHDAEESCEFRHGVYRSASG
jgi:hypothetical protein